MPSRLKLPTRRRGEATLVNSRASRARKPVLFARRTVAAFMQVEEVRGYAAGRLRRESRRAKCRTRVPRAAARRFNSGLSRWSLPARLTVGSREDLLKLHRGGDSCPRTRPGALDER
jgi:hypothetical protein